SDFHVQRIFLRGNYEVRTISAEFAVDLVADIGGYTNHGGGYTYAKCDSDAGQEFSPSLTPERFIHQANKHGLFLEHAGSSRDVRLLDDDAVGSNGCVQRNGIASACRTYRLRIDGCGAILTNHTVGSLVEANSSADLAGVKYRG